MDQADLVKVTGKTRYAKQAEWFKREFGVDVPRRDDHSVVMTWATFEALNARKAGLGSTVAKPKVELCYD
jgi:hypothetical protein